MPTLFQKHIPIPRISLAPVRLTESSFVIALGAFTGAMRDLLNLITQKRPEAARMELGQMSLYTPEAFIRSAEKGDNDPSKKIEVNPDIAKASIMTLPEVVFNSVMK